MLGKPEFSWSSARDGLFVSCPKAYYFKYYASYGVWDKYSEEKSRKIFALKNYVALEIWLADIVGRALRTSVKNSFMRGAAPDMKAFKTETAKIFFREWNDSLRPSGEGDRKMKILETLASSDEKVLGLLFDRCENALKTLFADFAESPLWQEIVNIEAQSLRDFRNPDSFFVEKVKVWTSPSLIWQNRTGGLHVLNIVFTRDDSPCFHRLQNGISSFFVSEKFSFPYDRTFPFSFCCDIDTGKSEVHADHPDICEIRSRILESSLKMAEFHSFPERLLQLQGPKCKESCAKCAYREYCSQIR